MSSPDLDILASARRDMARQQLRALLILFAVSLVIIFVVALVLGNGEALVLSGANLLLLAIITWLRGRDRLTAAAMLASVAMVASAMWGTWTTTWGLLDSTAVVFVAAGVFAALLLPRPYLLTVLGLAAAGILLVGFRGPLRLAEGYEIGRTETVDVVLVLLAVLVAASWVRRQNEMLWDTLQRAVAHEQDLAASHAELQQRQAQVEASEQRWRSLVTAAPDWIVQLARDGTIVFANRDGYFAEDPIGRRLTELVLPPDGEKLTEAIATAATRGTSTSVELELELPEGRRRAAFHVGPLHLENEPDHVIVLVSDVTERQQLQEQLLQTQKLDSMGQLAGGVAHDFNNLLTVIGGHADLARMQLDPENAAREDLETILQTCDHATALTRQILAFSRRQPLRPEPVDLAAALDRMQRMLLRLIGEDIELEEAHTAGLPPIEADPGSVEQVVMNLVVNARDAIRETNGATDRRIRIDTSPRRFGADDPERPEDLAAGDYVELRVSDTGVGMDQELQSRVFEPFFTTKEPGRGTGLGLATVYGIVTQSGGMVRIESAPGRGTTVGILWPTAASPAVVDDRTRPAINRLDGDEHVLVVEDDDAVRDLASAALRRRGYRVSSARDAREALKLVDENRDVAAVITDVVMPGLSGIELGNRLPAGMPVLFCSGHTDLGWLPDGSLPPSEIFLAKPYAPDELARKVRGLLDARESR